MPEVLTAMAEAGAGAGVAAPPEVWVFAEAHAASDRTSAGETNRIDFMVCGDWESGDYPTSADRAQGQQDFRVGWSECGAGFALLIYQFDGLYPGISRAYPIGGPFSNLCRYCCGDLLR
ncbi:MAG TPA: hypothetical protein VII02_01485 [Gemmatimonadaceae bacterium]